MATVDAQINLRGPTSPALMHHMAELQTQNSITTFAVSTPGMLKDLWSAQGWQNLSNRPPQPNSFSENSFTQLFFLTASWDTDELLSLKLTLLPLKVGGISACYLQGSEFTKVTLVTKATC